MRNTHHIGGFSRAICEQMTFFCDCALVTVRVTCPRPFNSDSDLFEQPDDILAHVCQADNDVVVVDVAEHGVVSALPPGLVQDQIPAIHSGQQILVLSENSQGKILLASVYRCGFKLLYSIRDKDINTDQFDKRFR